MNLLKTLTLLGALSLSTLAEETPSPSDSTHSTGFESEFLTWLNEGDKSLTLGNYTSYGRTRSDRRPIFNSSDGGSAGYSSSYFIANYETPKFANLQLGLGLYGHIKTFDSKGAYGEKYPSDEHIYFTDLYAKYHFTDKLFIKGGRFNIREVAERFDPQYGEGALIQYTDSDELKFQLGFVSQYAFFFNDFVVDYTGVDDANRFSYDPAAAEEVDDIIYYSELTLKLNEFITINPYAYYQDNYVGWYGLDTTIHFKDEHIEYGLHLYSYYIDNQLESNLNDINEGSFNYSINPFYMINQWQFLIGYSQFGDNPQENNPNWGYRYFTNAFYDDIGSFESIDLNPLYGTKGTDAYFSRIAYQEETWLLSFSAGYFDPEENANLENLWELQIGGSLSLTENIGFGARIVSVLGEEKTGVVNQDVDYFEAWLTYTF